MIVVSGYTVHEEIYESHNSVIARAREDASGREVIIKVLPEEFPSPEKIARFRREFVEPCRSSVVVRGGPILDLLLLGHTMHLVHHLFPTVPWYRLGRVYATVRSTILARGGREVMPGSLPRPYREPAWAPDHDGRRRPTCRRPPRPTGPG